MTQSRHSPSSLPCRRYTPTTRNPHRSWSARLAAFSGKISRPRFASRWMATGGSSAVRAVAVVDLQEDAGPGGVDVVAPVLEADLRAASFPSPVRS